MLIFHICRKKSTNSYPYSSSGWWLHGSVARSRRASNPAAHHHNHRADNQQMLFQSLEEDMKFISNCTFLDIWCEVQTRMSDSAKKDILGHYIPGYKTLDLIFQGGRHFMKWIKKGNVVIVKSLIYVFWFLLLVDWSSGSKQPLPNFL